MSKGLKYLVKIEFKVNGNVDKNDVVGALFGQTEGLFGPKLDLRELQKSGRVGRIEVEANLEEKETKGSIVIPSGLSRASTALIAASIESIDKVGPYAANFKLEGIEDTRKTKRVEIVKRAKEILRSWRFTDVPSLEDVEDQVEKAAITYKVGEFGAEKLPAGPDVASSDSIIIVEGRADVIKLLEAGINNAIALNGVSVPKSIVELCKKKEATALLDGDRGGEFILRELLREADVKYVIRAPRNMEVEELSPTAIRKLLKAPIPIDRFRKKAEKKPEEPERDEKLWGRCKELLEELKGTLEARVLDKDCQPIFSCSVSELAKTLPDVKGAYAVVFDGIVTQRIVNIAKKVGIKYVCGARAKIEKKAPSVRVMLPEEL
ncbi:MAG: DNA primase DnaG [Candidatus Bathyarchaeia archaeon]